MALATIVALLQAALLLLTAAQGAAVPQALHDRAVQVAQQAITQATAALSQSTSNSVPPVQISQAPSDNLTGTSAEFSPSPTAGGAPLRVTFTMSGAADAFETFIFGDGDSFSVGAPNNFDNASCNAAAQNTVCHETHTYTTPGAYTAAIEDASGNVLGSAEITVSSP